MIFKEHNDQTGKRGNMEVNKPKSIEYYIMRNRSMRKC